MKRVLLDVNIILDVVLDRRPHVNASAALWAAIEMGKAEGLLAGHAVTTIYYLVAQAMDRSTAKRVVASLLDVFGVAAIDKAVLREALHSNSEDYEDAVTASSAHRAGCDFIVTRDPRGFRDSRVRALSPEAALPLLIV